MRPKFVTLLSCFVVVTGLCAATLETKPNDPYFARIEPIKAPATSQLLLKKGDRLAIIGDSITEQKLYSRMIETYLTVCTPELEITARQYGWSGERAPGFLARMTNDCLRFAPTIATTCYGMNDHEYKPYEDRIGKTYRETQTAIVDSFKANRVRVVLGSPGPVGKMPSWVKTAAGTVADLNENLCKLRNIDIDIAKSERVAFADVFWPMYVAGFEGQKRFGTNFMIAGKDGVHPGMAGQTVMAYAFLKAMGLDGELGTFTIDLRSNKAKASKGHTVSSSTVGEFTFESTRFPFCATGAADSDGSIRAAMALIPFNEDLNRMTLLVKNATAPRYSVTWGAESKTFTREQLSKGVNLAAEFATNPFTSAFAKVDNAVGKKQAYETTQIKTVFHQVLNGQIKSAEDTKDPEIKQLLGIRTPDGKLDVEGVIQATEIKRGLLAQQIREAIAPVRHLIKIATAP